MNIDDELKRALARRSPDEGFAERVMQRLAAEASSTPARSRFLAPRVRRLAAAAVLVLILAGVGTREVIERHRQAAGQRARRQLLTALEIAGAKVRMAQREIRKTSEQ